MVCTNGYVFLGFTSNYTLYAQYNVLNYTHIIPTHTVRYINYALCRKETL